ncbi:hypothetical protein LTR84_010186 [Exophiala bonariae]|uniref:Uncharacterized protein n=1 Tax=Exophiala bonariae TaxID=1690606 RepID=A0AAV9MTV1_9EURO|nr:hypothetical protein LTR84_010186 [Exophiala bonariae]
MASRLKFRQKLEGTRVLIIGGSSGFGFGVAEGCMEWGVAHLSIASSSEKRVTEAISRLRQSYPDATTEIKGHACDLSNESTIDANIKTLFAAIGTLDHLVFTAGDAPPTRDNSDLDMQFIKNAGMVRFFAPLLVAAYGRESIATRPESSITLTTGVSGERPIPGWPVACSYLAGLHGMTRSLALDLKPIRVNLVSPGAANTEMWDVLDDATRSETMESLARATTTGRVGAVEDIAEAYLYSMRDANLSGAIISTNGGRCASNWYLEIQGKAEIDNYIEGALPELAAKTTFFFMGIVLC